MCTHLISDGLCLCGCSMFWCVHGLWIAYHSNATGHPLGIGCIALCYKTPCICGHAAGICHWIHRNSRVNLVLLWCMGSQKCQDARQCTTSIWFMHCWIGFSHRKWRLEFEFEQFNLRKWSVIDKKDQRRSSKKEKKEIRNKRKSSKKVGKRRGRRRI